MDSLKTQLERVADRVRQGEGERQQRGQEHSSRRAAIIDLWQLMSSMYGHKWESSYGAEVDPDGVWLAVCGDLTPVQIRAGMAACRDQCLTWPPSAPEFRGMCKPPTDWEHKRIESADRERQQKALQDLRDEDQKAAHAESAMSGIRELLRMGGT